MNIRIYSTILIAGLLFAISCTNNSEKKKLSQAVIELEAVIMTDTTSLLDRSKALELIQAYENYANALPNDTLSAEYLYKGAEILMNVQMGAKAIEFHQRVINNYPEFDKIPYCLFLQAFIYENQLQQYETAKQLYLKFINEYPDHPLADDAVVSVENMGKSLEELIQSWEAKENN